LGAARKKSASPLLDEFPIGLLDDEDGCAVTKVAAATDRKCGETRLRSVRSLNHLTDQDN
jgi:hypothetical protein